MKNHFTLLICLFLFLGWNQNLNAQCANDVEAPVLVTITGFTATLETTGTIEVFATDLVVSLSDNCTENPELFLSVESIPAGSSFVFTSPGTYVVSLQATDEQGNVTVNTLNVIIEGTGQAGCDPDEEAPNIWCINDLEIELSPSTGVATLNVDNLVSNTSDNCSSSVDVYMTFPGAPMVDTYEFAALGNYPVTVTVQDLAGNSTFCTTFVAVVEDTGTGPCEDDLQPPVLICINGVEATLSEETGEVEISVSDLIAALSDNCSSANDIDLALSVEGVSVMGESFTFVEPGIYVVSIYATDEAGNTTSCETYVIIMGNGSGCEADTQAPDLGCINGLSGVLTPAGTLQIWALDFIAWAGDNCTPEDSLDFTISLGASPAASESITFEEAGIYNVRIYVTDTAGNSNYCETYVIVQDLYEFTGIVFIDTDEDCMPGAGETTLENWPVKVRYDVITGTDTLSKELFTLTDANGEYQLSVARNPDEVILDFELFLELGTAGGSCPNSFLVSTDLFEETQTLHYDLPNHLLEDCFALEVDIAAPYIRRCFNSSYAVSVCNVGTELAEDASVDVMLDEFLQYTGSSIPWLVANGQTYTFDLGDIGPGECKPFQIFVEVSCNALLGQTHCTEASVSPASPCNTIEQPELTIEGVCDGNEVVFRITNNSAVDMQDFVGYAVVEDVIMYLSDSVKLNGGEWQEVVIDANGSTYHLQLEQPMPGSLEPEGLAVEACGTNQQGGVSLGFVTQLPFNSLNPEIDIDCQENIGAFDPNDKQAWPLGVGEDHRIRPGTTLEYMIRFQNTGTDTAFNIVIKDTLSPYLNLATVKAGAASHDYRFNVLEGNVLQFSFDNIALPDSNINAAASQGFVKFSVQQMPDNPIGTEILNQAAIYFDFNEPIITNPVSRLVSEEIIVVSVDDPQGPTSLATSVFPNPFSALTTIQVSGLNGQIGELLLFDVNGKHLTTQILENGQAQLSAENLKAGLYFFSIQAAGQTVSRGKVVVR